MTAEADPSGWATSTLLVRRAPAAAVDRVGALLGSTAVDVGEVNRLARTGGLFVLGDVTLPPSSPAVAAALFDLHRSVRRARLMAVGVVTPLRRRGLGRRLFAGATMLLRSEGFERIDAAAGDGTGPSAFLVAVGFEPDVDAGPARLVYWL